MKTDGKAALAITKRWEKKWIKQAKQIKHKNW
jgi:hypothetical protein